MLFLCYSTRRKICSLAFLNKLISLQGLNPLVTSKFIPSLDTVQRLTVWCLKEIKPHNDDCVISHLSPTISSSYGGGPLRTGGLGTRTVGYPVLGFGNIGTEFGLRESNAQMEDLKRKLKMVL